MTSACMWWMLSGVQCDFGQDGRLLGGGHARCLMKGGGDPKFSITISLLSLGLNFWFIRWEMALTERPGHFQNILDLPTAAAGNHVPSNKWDFEPLSCLPRTECLCLELPTPFLIHMQVSSSLSSYQFLWVNSSFQIPYPLCSLKQWFCNQEQS